MSRRICANIIALDREAYDEEYLWSIDQQRDIYNVNPDSIMLIRDKKKTIGYLNYIVITEEKYNHLKRAQVFNNDLHTADVLKLRKRRKNYMLVESINVAKSYESKKMIQFIERRFRVYLRNKRKQEYRVHGILSIAVSDFEKDFLKSSTFAHIKDYRGEEQLYELAGTDIERYLA